MGQAIYLFFERHEARDEMRAENQPGSFLLLKEASFQATLGRLCGKVRRRPGRFWRMLPMGF